MVFSPSSWLFAVELSLWVTSPLVIQAFQPPASPIVAASWRTTRAGGYNNYYQPDCRRGRHRQWSTLAPPQDVAQSSDDTQDSHNPSPPHGAPPNHILHAQHEKQNPISTNNNGAFFQGLFSSNGRGAASTSYVNGSGHVNGAAAHDHDDDDKDKRAVNGVRTTSHRLDGVKETQPVQINGVLQEHVNGDKTEHVNGVKTEHINGVSSKDHVNGVSHEQVNGVSHEQHVNEDSHEQHVNGISKVEDNMIINGESNKHSTNGASNNVMNGVHINGHSHQKEHVNGAGVINGDSKEHVNGAHINGHINGASEEFANGVSNEYANGASNEHADGSSKDHINGVSEKHVVNGIASEDNDQVNGRINGSVNGVSTTTTVEHAINGVTTAKNQINGFSPKKVNGASSKPDTVANGATNDEMKGVNGISVNEETTSQINGAAVNGVSALSTNDEDSVPPKAQSLHASSSSSSSATVELIPADQVAHETLLASAATATLLAIVGLHAKPVLGFTVGAMTVCAAYLDSPLGAWVRRAGTIAGVVALAVGSDLESSNATATETTTMTSSSTMSSTLSSVSSTTEKSLVSSTTEEKNNALDAAVTEKPIQHTPQIATNPIQQTKQQVKQQIQQQEKKPQIDQPLTMASLFFAHESTRNVSPLLLPTKKQEYSRTLSFEVTEARTRLFVFQKPEPEPLKATLLYEQTEARTRLENKHNAIGIAAKAKAKSAVELEDSAALAMLTAFAIPPPRTDSNNLAMFEYTEAQTRLQAKISSQEATNVRLQTRAELTAEVAVESEDVAESPAIVNTGENRGDSNNLAMFELTEAQMRLEAKEHSIQAMEARQRQAQSKALMEPKPLVVIPIGAPRGSGSIKKINNLAMFEVTEAETRLDARLYGKEYASRSRPERRSVSLNNDNVRINDATTSPASKDRVDERAKQRGLEHSSQKAESTTSTSTDAKEKTASAPTKKAHSSFPSTSSPSSWDLSAAQARMRGWENSLRRSSSFSPNSGEGASDQSKIQQITAARRNFSSPAPLTSPTPMWDLSAAQERLQGWENSLRGQTTATTTTESTTPSPSDQETTALADDAIQQNDSELQNIDDSSTSRVGRENARATESTETQQETTTPSWNLSGAQARIQSLDEAKRAASRSQSTLATSGDEETQQPLVSDVAKQNLVESLSIHDAREHQQQQVDALNPIVAEQAGSRMEFTGGTATAKRQLQQQQLQQQRQEHQQEQQQQQQQQQQPRPVQPGKWSVIVRPTTHMAPDKYAEDELSPIERIARQRAENARRQRTVAATAMAEAIPAMEEPAAAALQETPKPDEERDLSQRLVYSPHRRLANQASVAQYVVR
ncbi:hypothetical protein ACA910_014726 [Epithemia clementina (nom. ined.)]